MKKIIGCYAIGHNYIVEANRLRRSLSLLGLTGDFFYHEVGMPWSVATHHRPIYLQSLRRRFPRHLILSLDADCVVHSDPWLVLEKKVAASGCDVAFHTFVRPGRPAERLPGTLLLNPTPTTDVFLDKWDWRNKQVPNNFDRFNFNWAINNVPGIKSAELPAEFCWIFDLSERAYGVKQPVIEHLQASRENKRPLSKNNAARKMRLQEIEQLLHKKEGEI